MKASTITLSVFLLFFLMYSGKAQNPFESPSRVEKTANKVFEGNPFERSVKEVKTITTKPDSPVTVKETTQNPFEQNNTSLAVVPNSNTDTGNTSNPFEQNNLANINKPVEVAPIIQPTRKNKKEPRSPSITSNSFLLIISTLLAMLIAFIIASFGGFLEKVKQSFFSTNLLNLAVRDKHRLPMFGRLLLYLFFGFNAAFFLFLAGQYFGFLSNSFSNWAWIGILSLGIFGLYAVRHLTLNFMGSIFPLRKEMQVYGYTIEVFNQVLGLVLFATNILLAFAPNTLIAYILYTFLAIAVLVYLYRGIRGLAIGAKFLAFHKFHFFMYLCTIEIAPVLILIKMISNY